MSDSSQSVDQEISRAIRQMCERPLGVLDSGFLCKSIGSLNPPHPLCVTPSEPISSVLATFAAEKIGSVLVVDSADRLVGIFTERDCVTRVLQDFTKNADLTVDQFMTKDPVAESPEITVAYALNLMCHGRFRHLPLVDSEKHPIGVISVRDVMDAIVASFMDTLMNVSVEP